MKVKESRLCHCQLQ